MFVMSVMVYHVLKRLSLRMEIGDPYLYWLVL
jgi:hypothetical protein